MSSTLTLSINETLLARLDAFVAKRGATREDIVQVAIEELMCSAETGGSTLEDWQLALIDEGLAAADKGDVATSEDVDAIFSKYRG